MKIADFISGRLRGVFPAIVLATGVAVAGALMPGVASAGTTWSAPVTLASVAGTPTPALVTAGQASGTAVVAWTGNGLLSASARTPSAGWSRATAVSPMGQTASSPAVVMRPDGSAVLAWAAQRSTDTVIEASVWTAAAGWGAPAVVSGTGMSFTGPVALGADGSGNVLAVWGQYNSSTGAISVVSATLPGTGPWSAPAVLATPAGAPFNSSIRQVSVAVNAAGAAVVGWIRKNNDLYGDVITRAAGGSFGAPVTIATGPWRPALQQLHSLRVAIDAGGRASAAWNNSYANASAQQSNGTWAAATVFPMAYASNPALAVDGTGTAQMLWAVGGAEASSLPPGGSWTTPATAVFPGAKPVDVGIAPNGTSDFAGWYDSGTNEITAAVHTSAGWGTPSQVSPPLPTPPWIAAVSTAPVGAGALIAWISGTGNPGTVQVSIGS
jgi:hypothetical protein